MPESYTEIVTESAILSQDHRKIEVGSDLWRSSGLAIYSSRNTYS